MMLELSPLGPQSKAAAGAETWPPYFSSGCFEPLCCLARYKDNPFSLESFGSRWDSDATWGMDRVEEKEPEVTISSIRPISERYRGSGAANTAGLLVTMSVAMWGPLAVLISSPKHVAIRWGAELPMSFCVVVNIASL